MGAARLRVANRPSEKLSTGAARQRSRIRCRERGRQQCCARDHRT